MGRDGVSRKQEQNELGLGVLWSELRLVSTQHHSLDPEALIGTFAPPHPRPDSLSLPGQVCLLL